MKNFKILFLLLFLVSCTNVYFTTPQPTYLQNIDKVPINFQGNFERVEVTPGWGKESTTTITNYIISDEFCVLDNDTLEVGSDDLVIKNQGNNLYVNLRKDSVYELYVLSRYNYFGSDSLIIKTIFLDDNIRDNYVDYFTLSDYLLAILDSSYFKERDDDSIIIDSLNVNELNTLLNYNPNRRKFKFNK